MLRAAVRHQSHQQIKVRRRRPGGIRPLAFHRTQLAHRARPCLHKRVVSAAVEDHQNVVIALSVFAFAAFLHLNVSTILPAIIRVHAASCAGFFRAGFLPSLAWTPIQVRVSRPPPPGKGLAAAAKLYRAPQRPTWRVSATCWRAKDLSRNAFRAHWVRVKIYIAPGDLPDETPNCCKVCNGNSNLHQSYQDISRSSHSHQD